MNPNLPAPLRRAIILMYAGAALTLLSVVFLVSNRSGAREEVQLIAEQQGDRLTGENLESAVNLFLTLGTIMAVAMAGLWVLMAFLIKRGKNWARLLASGMGLLNVLYTLMEVLQLVLLGQVASGVGIMSVATLTVAALALFYLWTSPVREWFNAQRDFPR